MALMALMGGAAMAQSTVSLKLGGAFPMGDFADAKVSNGEPERWGLFTKDNEGGAGTGFNVGLEWCFDISSVSGLGLVLSVDGFYNGLNEDLNDFFEDMKEEGEDELDEFSLTTPSYINVPVMIGARYKLNVAQGVGLFATGAAGLNARFVTPFSTEYEYHGYDEYDNRYTRETAITITYKPAFTFGFKVAAGVIFADKYTVEVGYYNLGAGKVKAEMEEKWYHSSYGHEDSSEKETFKSITPEMVTLRFGIGF